VVREVLNHRLCMAHPNIVQFREIFLTHKHLAIVMEYANGGDMFDYVIKNKGSGPGEGLPEDVARGFFQQLILALDFCQKLGIVNR
jgi:serine/threonine-protein kinase SRK2